LGIGCGNSAMDLGLDRLHDLRLEGWQLRQDVRLAWRRHHPAALVLSDRLRHPRRGGTERRDRASNHARRGVLARSTRLWRLCWDPRRILTWLVFGDGASAPRHGAHDSRTPRSLRSIPPVHQLAERLATT